MKVVVRTNIKKDGILPRLESVNYFFPFLDRCTRVYAASVDACFFECCG